jgi:hypothetical protein
MFITYDLLEKYNACESGKRFFQRFYPNGVEVLELLENKHVPKEFLFWGEENLPVSKEELEKFNEVCGIKNSTRVFRSYNIEDSDLISNSNNIFASKVIKACKFINNSNVCFSSNDVEKGSFIFSSSEIGNSKYCLNASNIEDSVDISISSNITNCSHICNSHYMGRAIMVYSSTLSENCYFSSFLKNCKNCLFSIDQENKEYLLFNQPISEMVYQQVLRALLIKLKHETIKLYTEKEDDFLGTFIEPKVDFSTFFNELSPEFWKWVKTLPNFDSFIMYQITLQREFLLK